MQPLNAMIPLSPEALAAIAVIRDQVPMAHPNTASAVNHALIFTASLLQTSSGACRLVAINAEGEPTHSWTLGA